MNRFRANQGAKCLRLRKIWRRGRDSNPRYPFGYAGFQDRSHQPLGHLSACRRDTIRPLLASLQQAWAILWSRRQAERAGMEFHDFVEVRQEIGQAVVARVGVIFMFHAPFF